MENITIQVQSVLFNNKKKDLLKSIDAILNSKRVFEKRSNYNITIDICYGDASPARLFDEAEVIEIKNAYKNEMNFRYQYFGFNSGSAKGHNLLADGCKTRYMMIMNPDVLVSPLFFESVLPLLNDKEVGMVEARQTPVEHPKEYNIMTKETEWAATACVVFKTDIFNELNGFDDESFFMYCDDLDFSWRMRLLGYKILYQPLAPVYHAKRLSAKAKWQPTDAEKYYSAEAALMMAYKYANMQLVDEILRGFSKSGDDVLERAAQTYKKKKENGELPQQLDKEHKVARFLGNFYTEHRFDL